MQRIIDGDGTEDDLVQLLQVGESICPGAFPHASSERLGIPASPWPYRMTTICFVGPSAYVPVHSALTLFPEEDWLWSTVAFTIALSVLVHGVAATPVLRRLDLRRPTPAADAGAR